jgi:flagellin
MGLIVNTNIGSLNAQRSLNASNGDLSVAMERLSSGKKINSAKDDAAGFAIAERMTSQIKGLNMAAKNISDAQSFLGTLESMYQDQTDAIQRIRELAVQASNSTTSQLDREFLQLEALALVAEIQRAHDQTQYNGEVISGGWKKFQLGAEAGQNVETYVSKPSGFTGSIYGHVTQTYGLNETSIEVVIDSATGPFVHGDIALLGITNGESRFIHIASAAQTDSNGIITQTLELADGLSKELKAGFVVAAVASFDLSAPDDSAYTSGGRGSLKRVDLVNNASASISDMDTALAAIGELRSRMGALQNRLDFAISNVMNVSEATLTARSRIEDADFAAESAQLAKAQVLQQSGVAMLSQANASSQLVVSLVRESR